MEKKKRLSPRPVHAKWKINSNSYGGKILVAAGIFVIVLPLGLYCIQWLFNKFGVENVTILPAIKFSFAAGVVIAGAFILLLAIEFIQDHMLNQYYLKNKSQKLRLADGQFECQHCGARNISDMDKRCPICDGDFQLQ